MKTSIVIPTYNENGNIEKVIQKIHSAAGNRDHEIIVIDDYSNDGTWESLSLLQYHYPVKRKRKQGKKGKAYSLFEGFEQATGDVFAFIDGDQQYPPEEIFNMADKLKEDADVVVADRTIYKESKLRQIKSRIFKKMFGNFLLGLNHDVQSGLKVFKKEVFNSVRFKPRSPWTFDMEFLLKAKKAGYKIADHSIIFEKREFGKSKINSLTSTVQIALNALSLRIQATDPQNIIPQNQSMQWAGIGYKGKKQVTHSTLEHKYSAVQTMYLWQKIFVFSALVFFCSLWLVIL